MKTYQITFITNEEKNDSIIKAVGFFDGKIIKEDNIGRKKFAYPIKKETAGYFTNIVFNIDHKKIFELEKKLRLDDSIIRYLLIFKEAEKKTTKKKDLKQKQEKELTIKKQLETSIEKEEKQDLIEKKKEEKPQIEKKSSTKDKPKIEEVKKEETITSLSKPKEKVASEDERLKMLEEKLDALLKE